MRWMRMFAAAPVLAVLLAATPAAAAPGKRPALAVAGVAFGVDRVDARSGTATVHLTWTVTDRDRVAAQISGAVTVQQFSRGQAVGAARVFAYSLLDFGFVDTVAVSGNARRSSYDYPFLVPRAGPRELTSWRVVSVTAADDRGNARTVGAGELAGPRATLVARGVVDTTAPAVISVGGGPVDESIVFDAGSGISGVYHVEIADAGSGFWKGRLTLTGPTGTTVTAPFRLVDGGAGTLTCGEDPGFSRSDTTCGVRVTVPTGSPAGRWEVTSIEVIDAAGNTGSGSAGPGVAPVQFTRNEVLSATDFTIGQRVVNNWRSNVRVPITLRPVGARGGITEFSIRTDNCGPGLIGDPITNPDGTMSVTWLISPGVERCVVTGIKLVDGAGNVALYGDQYFAPPIDLSVTRVPDTTPPVALAATISPTSVKASELVNRTVLRLAVTVDTTSLAPINGYGADVFNAAGENVSTQFGGTGEGPGGTVEIFIDLTRFQPGTYTVAFKLDDAARLQTSYGYPSGTTRPVPGGPLILTVTDD